MSLIAKNDGVNFELPEPGVYPAVCVWVIDLGMQEVNWQGQTKQKRKIKLAFELVGTKMKDSRPFFIGNNYTLSLNENADLHKHLVSWRGRQFSPEEMEGFDLKNVLGAACQINVIHNIATNGNTYANPGSIIPFPKGMQKPTPESEFIYYDTHNHADDIWYKIPEGIRNKINCKKEESFSETENSDMQKQALDDLDDDIPF